MLRHDNLACTMKNSEAVEGGLHSVQLRFTLLCNCCVDSGSLGTEGQEPELEAIPFSP